MKNDHGFMMTKPARLYSFASFNMWIKSVHTKVVSFLYLQ